MENEVRKTRVNLDGKHSLDISVNEAKKSVVVELMSEGEMPTFIYAEKFDAPCNYLRTAIKKGILYLSGGEDEQNSALNPDRNPRIFLNKNYDMI